MTEKSTRPRGKLVRFDSLDDMPPAAPLSGAFKALTDDEIERRAAADRDAGVLPAEFWNTARPVETETKEQITLRLDPDVLRHFRSTGKGYQSRINAVLKSYVKAKEKTG